MHHGAEPSPSPSARILIRGMAGGVLAVILCLLPLPAGADTAKPQLRIAVDNGREFTDKGDRLEYAVTVSNLGGAKIRDLLITQSVPAGATFESADDRGVYRAGKVTWKLNLKASKNVVLRASMTVASTPDEELRLATVACAQILTTGAPLVCASDSDQLPAGAAAETAQRAAEQIAAGSDSRVWWYAGGAVAVIGAAVGVLLVVRARSATSRRHRPTSAG
jgi:uncharacterized repeat protein (TIGR01451 family)